jgi:hypothetical protein
MSGRDSLNELGEFILSADTRWVFVAVVAALFVFLAALAAWRRKTLSREQTIRLALSFLQLYTALGIVSLLILTKPPAVHLVGDYVRQTGGFIAGVFLIAGVIEEVKRTWKLA